MRRSDYHIHVCVCVSMSASVNARACVYVKVCGSANVSLSRARVDCRQYCKLHGMLMYKKAREFQTSLSLFRHLFSHAFTS